MSGKSARAVPPLCVLYPGICRTTEYSKTKKKNLIVVEKCQHILAVSEVRFVDLSLPALGDVGEHSVSVDICRAA